MTKDRKPALPSDALTKPTRRAPWIVGLVAAAAVAVSAVTFGPALAAQLNPAPAPTATAAPVDTHPTLSPDELAAVQGIADTQQAKAAADAAAAKAAAEAAAAKSAQKSTSYAPGQAPKGTPIPQHLVTDPNAGNYGQYDIEDPGFFCASKSGSTVNGVPVCD